MSKCPKCENTSFEIELNTPAKSRMKVWFVQCSMCKTVIGVMDYYAIGETVYKIAKKLNV